MMIGVMSLIGTVINGIKQHIEGKQKIKQAVTENKVRLAQNQQDHNHEWEMKQLEGAGYKDDVLFYAFIAMFIWAGFDPEGAKAFWENLNVLPDWFIKTWLWLVASVIGIKKIGDYAPSLINGIKGAFKKE